jgi:hypothetical protein
LGALTASPSGARRTEGETMWPEPSARDDELERLFLEGIAAWERPREDSAGREEGWAVRTRGGVRSRPQAHAGAEPDQGELLAEQFEAGVRRWEEPLGPER